VVGDLTLERLLQHPESALALIVGSMLAAVGLTSG
jgi:hypothetical protein